MVKLTLRNLAAHRLRLVLTLMSVVLGTAFVAGSFIFTDTLQSTFNGIFDGSAKGVDVRVSPAGLTGAIPMEDIGILKGVEGVAKVAPNIRGSVVLLDKTGKPVQSGGASSFGSAYLPPDQTIADEPKFVAGHPPAEGEVALNVGAARLGGYSLGDDVRIVVNSQPDPITVHLTGLYSVSTDTGGYVGALFEGGQATQLFTDGQHVDFVDLAAAPTITPRNLASFVASVFPNLKVQTGDQVRAEIKKSIYDQLSFVNYFMLAFSGISLLVATFIIYNTFSMIVAQRLRELALLRAIGASRTQVRNSVTLEAAIIGIIGSALGVVCGAGMAYGLRGVLNLLGFALPTGNLEIAVRTVVIAVTVGIVVTIASAYSPARRAGIVAPVEAMRTGLTTSGEITKNRVYVAAGIALLGLAGVVIGVLTNSDAGNAATLVGVGAGVIVLAMTLAAPALMKPLVGALGVATRPLGSLGMLGRRNAIRNPRRTAATASALTLGLFLVSLVSILGSSAKASIDGLIDDGVHADFVLVAAATGPLSTGIPSGASADVAKVPGVVSVTPVHLLYTSLFGKPSVGASTDNDISTGITLDMESGVNNPPPDGVLISDDAIGQRQLGDTVVFAGADGQPVTSKIAGVYKKNVMVGSFVAGPELYSQLTVGNKHGDLYSFVKTAPGADPAAVRTGLENATAHFFTVQVMDHEQFKGQQTRQIDTLLGILYALLGLAVIIGILGIVNTLALSVVERRREIGMLRAVGMLRAQVRRIVYVESVLIAVSGAIIGIVLGVPLGAAFVHTLASKGLGTINIPWSQVVLMLVASGVVGVLAAVWPAIRAARTAPLEAIADL